MNHYKGKISNYYFWRTYDQKEIDLVEESGGILSGFEFKWGTRKAKVPDEFLKTYDNSTYKLITPENYLEFIGLVYLESRKSGVGSRKSGVGSRESEVGSRESGDGSRKSEVGSRKSEVGSRKSEVGSRESEVGSRKS